MKTKLDEYIEKFECKTSEGGLYNYPDGNQAKFLSNIILEYNVKTILEIGFNTGHGSELYLSTKNDVSVISFDLGEYSVVKYGKEYIDKTFPERHKLILGDSTETIQEYAKNNKTKFDFIIIDGDHHYDGAIKDLVNCKDLAHKETIVWMDDVVSPKFQTKWYVEGPSRAWSEMVSSGEIIELGRRQSKQTHNDGKSRWKQGFVWGNYVI